MAAQSADAALPTCRRIQWQYVSLVCGLSLAVFLAIQVYDPPVRPTEGAKGLRQTRSRLAVTLGPAPIVVFYLAATDAQVADADAFEATSAFERTLVNALEPNRSVNLLMVRTPEEEVKAAILIDEAMAAANFSDRDPPSKFYVVDLEVAVCALGSAAHQRRFLAVIRRQRLVFGVAVIQRAVAGGEARHTAAVLARVDLPEAADAVTPAVGRVLVAHGPAASPAAGLDFDRLVQVVEHDCVCFDDGNAHPALRPMAGVAVSCFHNLTLTA